MITSNAEHNGHLSMVCKREKDMLKLMRINMREEERKIRNP